MTFRIPGRYSQRRPSSTPSLVAIVIPNKFQRDCLQSLDEPPRPLRGRGQGEGGEISCLRDTIIWKVIGTAITGILLSSRNQTETRKEGKYRIPGRCRAALHSGWWGGPRLFHLAPIMNDSEGPEWFQAQPSRSFGCSLGCCKGRLQHGATSKAHD